jgi:hypothetical protein
LVGRFYRRAQEWNACDSFDVAWAVGPKAASRLKDVRLGRQVDSYYPQVPRLAVAVSPARQRFIDAVDATCVNTYNLIQRAEHTADLANRPYPDWQVRDDSVSLELHRWQLRQLLRLGQPPQANVLYGAWLANFRARLAVEGKALGLERQGLLAASRRELGLLVGLRARGNLAGQTFGLVRCTSNGERTAIPVLSDGQPRPLP